MLICGLPALLGACEQCLNVTTVRRRVTAVESRNSRRRRTLSQHTSHVPQTCGPPTTSPVSVVFLVTCEQGRHKMSQNVSPFGVVTFIKILRKRSKAVSARNARSALPVAVT